MVKVRGWRGIVAVMLGVALGGSPAARAAGLKTVSAETFHSEVMRLEGVEAQCAAAAASCNGASVGDDVQVGDAARGGFDEHWEWLRAALKSARTAKDGERARLMREAEAYLTEIAQESGAASNPQQDFGHERAVANAVLGRPEFLRDGGPTWWDRAKARMAAWVRRFFEGVVEVGSAAPWLGTLLEWVFYVGAAVGLLFFLLRNIARQRLRVTLGDAALHGAAWESEADDWAKWARDHADAGEWREAVHCLYWAAIVSLETRRAWRHNPTRTPREYVRLLKPGSAQQQRLRSLTQIFERVWYGLRAADEAEYAEAHALYEQLAASAPEVEGSAAGTAEALSAGGVA